MVWLLYNILFALGFTLMLPGFLLRMCRRGGYRRDFLHRFARYRPELVAAFRERPGRVWVHAVSVGELFVALKLMEAMRERRPHLAFVLSVTTSTAHALAEQRLRDPDVLIYFPMDFPSVMRRALRIIQPQLLVLVECEFWPNLVRYARRRGIGIALVNGRLSDSSFRGYRRLRLFSRRIMPMIDALCMQGVRDAERIVELGAPSDRVHVMGSAKYEVEGPSSEGRAEAAKALSQAGIPESSTLLLGGSTWPGEEEALLRIYGALRRDFPALRLVLAPRHAERTPALLPLIAEAGFTCARRSQPGAADGLDHGADVFILDTTGELMNFYSRASIIFVGKSLTQHGGQNPIEPAVLGKSIIVGPHMENFPVVMEDFRTANALVQVDGEAGLRDAIHRFLVDADLRAGFGRRAGELVVAKRGAIRATVEKLLPALRH